MSKVKLNAAVAIEKATKLTSTEQVTEAHRKSKQTALFAGQTRVYVRNDDDGEQFPSENVKVQCTSKELLDTLSKQYSAQFDATATKDNGNTLATANVVVDGVTLVEKASVPFLLFVEKQLDYVKKFVTELPTLDTAENWTLDI